MKGCTLELVLKLRHLGVLIVSKLTACVIFIYLFIYSFIYLFIYLFIFPCTFQLLEVPGRVTRSHGVESHPFRLDITANIDPAL